MIVVDRVDRVADAVRIGRRSLSIARQSVARRDGAQPRRDGIRRRRPDRARSSGRCSRRRSTSPSSSTRCGPSEADCRTGRLRPFRRRFRGCPDVANGPRDDSSPMSELDSGKIAWRRGEHGPTYVGAVSHGDDTIRLTGRDPSSGYRRCSLDSRRGDRLRRRQRDGSRLGRQRSVRRPRPVGIRADPSVAGRRQRARCPPARARSGRSDSRANRTCPRRPNMRIKDLMTTNVLTVRVTTQLKDAASVAGRAPHLRVAGRGRRRPRPRRALGGRHPLQGDRHEGQAGLLRTAALRPRDRPRAQAGGANRRRSDVGACGDDRPEPSRDGGRARR